MYQTRPRKQESPRPHQHHSTNLISKALKESLLILRPLTHLSGGVIPFSRESVDSLAGSPLSLFTFMVRDSIRSLVLPPCCIQAGMAFWYLFIFKVVFSWISVWLFVLSYSYYSFNLGSGLRTHVSWFRPHVWVSSLGYLFPSY